MPDEIRTNWTQEHFVKHAEHPMNKDDAENILKDMQQRAKEPKNMYGGGQVDPSSAHMTDREQWRYYQGQLRTWSVLESWTDASMNDTLRGFMRGQSSLLEEIVNHIELRMAAKGHGVDHPNDSH